MSRDRMDLLLAQHIHSWDTEGWYLPLAKALEGIGPTEAAWQPPGGGNSIWQTLNHLNYYNERVLLRTLGAPVGPALPDNDATFQHPGNPEDAAGWQAAVAKAGEIAEGFRKALSELSDADLARPLGHGTVGETLPLLINHTAYHTGQIALIRKMQHSWPAQRSE
ncbi:MAG TPA: DinB family protein [Symbiobacteriaceae bacterium]|nr:DinB family protein [Symbiobacteriaceae bacterium]